METPYAQSRDLPSDLALSPNEVYIELRGDLSPDEVGRFSGDYGLDLVDLTPVLDPSGDGSPSRSFQQTSINEAHAHRRWFDNPAGNTLDQLRADVRVTVASPVFHRTDTLGFKTGISYGDQIAVSFVSGMDLVSIDQFVDALDASDITPAPLAGGPRRYLRLVGPTKRDAAEVCMAIAGDAVVKQAQPSWLALSAPQAFSPNDPKLAAQGYLTKINVFKGWDITQGNAGITIAVMDQGIDISHPDLAAGIVPEARRFNVSTGGHDVSPADDHGTALAGVAAATIDNGVGIAGVAGRCSIMPIKVPAIGWPDMTMAAAIEWAADHDVQVFLFGQVTYLPDAMMPDTTALIEAASAASPGMVFVSPAGNTGLEWIMYPATHPLVIAVGALQVGAFDPDDFRASFSGFGAALDVVAPGIAIKTTIPGDYSLKDGTSVAAPQVAGLAALIYAAVPGISSELVRHAIGATATKVGAFAYSPGGAAHPFGTWHKEAGYGRIDIEASLLLAPTL